MKVTKVSSPEVFKPVTLQIVLESKEELELLHTLMRYSGGIPQYLVDEGAIDKDKFGTLSEMMIDICRQVAAE